MQNEDKQIKQFRTETFPLYWTLIVWIIFLILSWVQYALDRKETTINNYISWWINISTWINIPVWVTISIPSDERWYLDYIMKYGKAWTDYIVMNPPRPLIIQWVKEENNKVMFKYLYNSKDKFDIPKTDKIWYVLFITNKEVPENRDFLLWIDWASVWWIRKKSSLPVYSYNEYLYPMKSVAMLNAKWKEYPLNLYDSIKKDNKLWLNAFVLEPWNYVEKIIIFFK